MDDTTGNFNIFAPIAKLESLDEIDQVSNIYLTCSVFFDYHINQVSVCTGCQRLSDTQL